MLTKSIARLLQAESSRLSINHVYAPGRNVNLPTTIKSRLFHTVKTRLKTPSTANETPLGETIKKPNGKSWRKIFLYGTLVPAGSFFVYYQFLNEKEKRKVRVVIESFGRAARSAQVALSIAYDYKWNLWGLNEVFTR